MVSEIKILTARTNLFRKSHNEVVEVAAIERPQGPPRPSWSTTQTCPSVIDDALLAFNPDRNVEWAQWYERQKQSDKGWLGSLSPAPNATCRHWFPKENSPATIESIERGSALPIEL